MALRDSLKESLRASKVGSSGEPVVIGNDQGELVAIDLRDDLTLVEYRPRLLDYRWSVFVALVVLNALDVITTTAVIESGGSENNPMMRQLVNGVWPAVMLKVFVLAVVAGLLGRCIESRRVEVMLAVTTGWYIAVVAWNLTVLAAG